MTAHEVPVPIGEQPALAVMMRDYMAEMAQFVGGVIHDAYPYFDSYWTEPEGRLPFWLKVDDTCAGFALVRNYVPAGSMEMAEFFVIRRFRRQGIGLAAARRLIGRYPGPWCITQRESNADAIAFWHRVLDGFVRYDETTTTTDAIRREQRFTVP